MCVCVWVPWQVPGRERRTPRCPGECGDDELNKQANRLTVPRRRLLSTACPPVLTLSEKERRGGKIKGRNEAGKEKMSGIMVAIGRKVDSKEEEEVEQELL